MRKSILLCSALLLAAGGGLAIAQPAPPPATEAGIAAPLQVPPDGAVPDRGPMPPPPRADRRGPVRGPAQIAERGPMPPPDGPAGPHRQGPGPDRRGPMPPPPPSGAHIFIERGSNKVDVKCADNEPMQVCAAIVQQLIAQGRKL